MKKQEPKALLNRPKMIIINIMYALNQMGN